MVTAELASSGLPEGVAAADVDTYVGRAFVAVRVAERPVAFWRWSWVRRRLVRWDRSGAAWSPAWSRELAEQAWRDRRRRRVAAVLGHIARWACPVVGGSLAAVGLVGLLLVGGPS